MLHRNRRCGTRSTSRQDPAASFGVDFGCTLSAGAGVDPAFMVPGCRSSRRKLVMKLSGGTPSGTVVVGKAFGDDQSDRFPAEAKVRRLAGIEVPLVEMLSTLSAVSASSSPAAARW